MPIAVPTTASSVSHPRSSRGSGAENAAIPDRTPLTSAYTATTATMVVRPMSGHRTSTKPNRMAATPFAAMIFQTRASMRSPSLAASSILLLTFDSKVSVGVDSVVISSSSVELQGRLADLPLEVVERFRDAVLLLLPRVLR